MYVLVSLYFTAMQVVFLHTLPLFPQPKQVSEDLLSTVCHLLEGPEARNAMSSSEDSQRRIGLGCDDRIVLIGRGG